jgi:hypothetical protein
VAGDTVGRLVGSENYFLLEDGRESVVGRPYGLTSQRAVSGEGMYFGSSERFEIGFYSGAGTALKRLIRCPIPNPLVTAQERAAYERERSERSRRSSPSFRRLLEMVEVPEAKPAYGRLLVDVEDNLWVAQYRRDPASQSHWDVFDRIGRWLGPVATPAGLEVLEIGVDYVLGVGRDAFDVEYVAVHELRKGAGA